MQEKEQFTELTVILKGSSEEKKKYTQTFPLHDDYQAKQDDPTIKDCISEARKSYQGKPYECRIKIQFDVVLDEEANDEV